MLGSDWGQVAAHPLVVAVAAPLILAIVVGIGAFSRRVLRILASIEKHVLPHFIRGDGVDLGAEADHTLPGRTLRLEEGQERMRREVSHLDGDLRAHMAEEATHVRQLHARIDDALAHHPKE